ncbi:hypothetical protein [Teredinibacter franksiae]|uniref:hypothetical protein n=1 Tax=Teredinibacter franksiae TaxID=2761453 RepID=UPI001625B91D|nr:hypothetical protein [Teredinibacter franksiae]
MPLCISDLDKSFLSAFENSTLEVDAFHHREHLRLAYITLVLNDVDLAYRRIRAGLLRMLQRNGVGSVKYHDTLTFAWIQAVKHFMWLTENANSSEEFLSQNQLLLDKNVMFTHYSQALINAEQARKQFVPPDLVPIPDHGGL